MTDSQRPCLLVLMFDNNIMSLSCLYNQTKRPGRDHCTALHCIPQISLITTELVRTCLQFCKPVPPVSLSISVSPSLCLPWQAACSHTTSLISSWGLVFLFHSTALSLSLSLPLCVSLDKLPAVTPHLSYRAEVWCFCFSASRLSLSLSNSTRD